MAVGELMGIMRKREPIRLDRGAPRRRDTRGFSLIEMMLATAVLLVGLVGVAQLVPASLLLDQANRTNSAALVVVQRRLDQIINQPLNSGLSSNLGYTDDQGNFCQLGDPTQPGVPVGSPVIIVNNRTLIDFSQATVPGYSLTYSDVNDPTGATWDLRWAVITATPANGGAIAVGKRFVVGARQLGGQGFVLPVTLDTTVSK